jgi:hypothetical protein
MEAARPFAVVSQNRNCFKGENLLPSLQYFLLENGAFTVGSDGNRIYFTDGGSLIWKRIWRLPL